MEENYNWIKARIILNGHPVLVRQESVGSEYFISKGTGVRFPNRELDFTSSICEPSDWYKQLPDMSEMEKLKAQIAKREFWREFRCKVYLHLIDLSDGMISPNEISKIANDIFTHAIAQDIDFFSDFDMMIYKDEQK